jgi:hypothetical protein
MGDALTSDRRAALADRLLRLETLPAATALYLS